jgi:hypothetical protein
LDNGIGDLATGLDYTLYSVDSEIFTGLNPLITDILGLLGLSFPL